MGVRARDHGQAAGRLLEDAQGIVHRDDADDRRPANVLQDEADVADLIREIRRRLNVSQEKLAQRLKVSFPTINRWENSRAKPSPLALKQIEDLARGLGERGKDLLQEFFPGEES